MEFDFAQFCVGLVTAMADAVIFTDGQGTIRVWNGGAQHIFGFSAEEAVGASLDLIIPEKLRARHWEGFDHMVQTGERRYPDGAVLAVPAMRKDGVRISVEFTVVPFYNEDHVLTGIAAVLRDVTRQFQELQALRRRVAQGQGGLSPS
ncbi:PAS domain S-box protein [Sulfobacillus sp. hq2]|uniref:PAS domain-containing protein n=1 Tax=Sulfobacillus TaxID=28033 RepID=UPI000CD02A49|nr:PAS domain S-box protein [Sulfobacillus sp. hq2]POB10524.1 PAS sensor domain-containing protein [Sulfobacillus sp. hq2]